MTTNIVTDLSPPRPRATSRDVAEARVARRAAAPIIERIGPMHVAVARLASAIDHGLQHGQIMPAWVEELDALETNVNAQERALSDAISHVPVPLRRHGRIEDAKRALASVSARIDEARTALQTRRP